jgi:hypothetical protein
MYDAKDYPAFVSRRTGCKVSWLRYKTLAEAEQASDAAKHNAKIVANLGFDFGYQSPGEIIKMDSGLYEVVIP